MSLPTVPSKPQRQITRGAPVVVTTATGERLPMWAMTGPQHDHEVPAVWVCSRDGSDKTGTPWPLESVEIDPEETP